MIPRIDPLIPFQRVARALGLYRDRCRDLTTRTGWLGRKPRPKEVVPFERACRLLERRVSRAEEALGTVRLTLDATSEGTVELCDVTRTSVAGVVVAVGRRWLRRQWSGENFRKPDEKFVGDLRRMPDVHELNVDRLVSALRVEGQRVWAEFRYALSDTQRRAVRALREEGGGPIVSDHLAGMCKRAPSGTFRTEMGALVRMRVVKSSRSGYELRQV